MEFRFIIQTLFEIAVAAFIIYGLIFEERFAQTEKKVICHIKRFFRQTFSSRSYYTNHN